MWGGRSVASTFSRHARICRMNVPSIIRFRTMGILPDATEEPPARRSNKRHPPIYLPWAEAQRYFVRDRVFLVQNRVPAGKKAVEEFRRSKKVTGDIVGLGEIDRHINIDYRYVESYINGEGGLTGWTYTMRFENGEECFARITDVTKDPHTDNVINLRFTRVIGPEPYELVPDRSPAKLFEKKVG